MNKNNTVYVVYDDKCPFCRNYCQLIRIREASGSLELIDARKPSAMMEEITVEGLDIDRGMVVKIDRNFYYGSDAIHILALLSTKSGIFNRFTYWIFRSKKITSILYPLLRDCRNIALKLMGIPLIKNLEKS